MRDFIEYLIKEIADNPEKVTVTEKKPESTFIYTIDVDEKDMGNIIGKGGRMIRSIRNLCKAKAIKDNIHINIELKNEYLLPQESTDQNSSEE